MAGKWQLGNMRGRKDGRKDGEMEGSKLRIRRGQKKGWRQQTVNSGQERVVQCGAVLFSGISTAAHVNLLIIGKVSLLLQTAVGVLIYTSDNWGGRAHNQQQGTLCPFLISLSSFPSSSYPILLTHPNF